MANPKALLLSTPKIDDVLYSHPLHLLLTNHMFIYNTQNNQINLNERMYQFLKLMILSLKNKMEAKKGFYNNKDQLEN